MILYDFRSLAVRYRTHKNVVLKTQAYFHRNRIIRFMCDLRWDTKLRSAMELLC